MASATARDARTAELMEIGGALVQSGSDDEYLAYALHPHPLRWFSGRRPLFLVAAVAVLVVVAVAAVANREAPRADVEGSVQLFGLAALATAASVMQSGSKMIKDMQTAEPAVEKQATAAFQPLLDLKAQMKEKPGVSQLKVNLTEMNDLSRDELLHPVDQDRNDGNVCPDDEELHADLCYKKCSTLTGGKYPIRTTAWSCCAEQPCSFFNSKFTSLLEYCSGYDVSGDAEGKECPHAPGACMENEEYSLGLCYKKCAILTNNTFPYRSAASTCCRYNNHIACLDALNTETKPEFNVGGGVADGHASTPNMTHAPMQRLTESNVPKNVDVSAYVAAGPVTA